MWPSTLCVTILTVYHCFNRIRFFVICRNDAFVYVFTISVRLSSIKRLGWLADAVCAVISHIVVIIRFVDSSLVSCVHLYFDR